MIEIMHRDEDHVAFRLADGAKADDALVGKNIVLLDGTRLKKGVNIFCGTCGEILCPIDLEPNI